MATKANIVIDQGASFSTVIQLTDDAGNALDLSAYTANGQIRKSYSSINSTSFGITLANGNVTLALNPNTTANIVAGRYVYDVVVTDSQNTITRIVEGIVTVNPSVTRSTNVSNYYTLTVANVNQTIYAGDLVYQSNGAANITGIVYDVAGPTSGASTNTVIIKISNTSGSFSVSNTYLLYDSNTSANGLITSITESVVR